MSIEFRAITLADAKKIYAWRNHEKVRQYSNSSTKIEFSDHLDWLNKALQDKTKHLLIAVDASIDIGVINFTDISSEHRTARVSVYLDPDLIGRGYGLKVLEAGVFYYKNK